MFLLNITCLNTIEDTNRCAKEIKLNHPTTISISHINNKHIVTEASDYDNKGRLKQSIHILCWKFGGVEKKIRGKIKNTPPLSAIEKKLIDNAKLS